MSNSENKQLALNMISQVIVFIVNFGITFLLTPFIVGKLGVDAYGFIGLSANILSYFQLATIALNSMAGRFVTIEYHKGNLEKANKYFSSVFYANLLMGIIMAAMLTVVLLYLEIVIKIPDNLLGDVKLLFGLQSLSSILSLIFNVYSVSPFIKNRLELASIRIIVSNVIRASILVVLFGLFTAHLWYMGVSILLCNIYLIIANYQIKKKLTPELHIKKSDYNFQYVKELCASGVWNLVSKLGDLLQRGMDLLFANIFISATAMGILSISTNVPFIILHLLGNFNSAFAPSITREYALGDTAAIVNNLSKSIRILSCVIMIPLTVLYIYGDVFYHLWVPSQDAILLQRLTIVGTFALIVTSPLEGFWNLFTATNKIKGSSIFMIINSIVVFGSVLIGLLFTKDITTQMFIIAGTRSVWGVFRGIFFLPIYGAYCMGQKWNYYYKFIFKPLIGILLSMILCSLIRFIYMPDSWITLLIGAIIVTVVTAMFASILILTKNDRQFFMRKVFKRISA